MNKFKILGEICLKCIILVTNFQKSPPPVPFFSRFWWFKVAWFGQIVFFQTSYDKIKL